ncbi:MAG: RNA polymerase sigma factor [Rhodothermales bacterium]
MSATLASLTTPPPQPLTFPLDGELVARAREGDRRAFRLLVEKYEAEIAATVVSMLGPSAEVDDVVQEVFIRFYQALDRFRGDAAVSTYLKRIAINRSLDVLRRRKRLLSRFLSRDDDTRHVPEQTVQTEAQIDARERARLVHEAIQALPPKHRAVVVLRMIEGYSTEETAEILGIAYGTVLSRLSRAHARLKTLLSPYIQEHL